MLIILLIVVLIFGTKRLKSIGGDLGGAVKGFRESMNDPEEEEDAKQLKQDAKADAEFSEEHDRSQTG